MERPKPGPNASSSDDLDRARAATQRLKGRPTARVAEPGYVSFARPTPTQAPLPQRPALPQPPARPLVARREPLKAHVAGFGSSGWNKLLDACIVTAGAESAFLMDPHGLIIATRGPKASDELEGVGARLMVAFEQADRINGGGDKGTLSMSVELPRGTLHGLRLSQPEGVLLLGLQIPGGLAAERQARLMALLAAAEEPRP